MVLNLVELGFSPFQLIVVQIGFSQIIMHCFPNRRNLEIADDVLDSDYSLVLKQAQNRINAAQTVIKSLLEK